jgi:hypothetical protein
MGASDVDDEGYELIVALLLRAGCLMEDQSVAFVSDLPRDPTEIKAAIGRLNETAADLGALAAAAGSILRSASRSA